MAFNPQDLPSDRRGRDVIDLYRRAQADIARQVERAVLAGNEWKARERRRQLAAVIALLDELGREADPIAREAVAMAFEDGAALANVDIKTLGASTSPAMERAFNAVNKEALKAAENALLGRLGDARTIVGRSTNDVFRKRQIEATARALLGADGSPAKASRRLVRQLRADGQVAFTDVSGRRWKLADYADMAVRTTTRQAVVEGQINRLAAHGIDLVRVSQHGSSCDICKPHEGKLIDLAGDTSVFMGEPVATGPIPPFHPRCLAPGTMVSGRGLYAGFRTMYSGDLVHLATRGAVTLSVTPNHPVMTGAGWLPAGELREGDEVLRATDGRGGAVGELDFHNVPALIEDVFDSFGASGVHAVVAASGDDFHGDARNFQSEVNVVFANRRLLHKLAVASAEKFGKLDLAGADGVEGFGVGDSASLELLGSAAAAASSCVGCGRRLRADRDTVAGKVFAHRSRRDVRVDGKVVESGPGEVQGGVMLDVRDRGLTRRSGSHLLGSSADMHSEVLQLGANAGRARVELASAVREGRAGGVEFDQVVRVDRGFYSGHVYDLSALDGNYCANTLIVSNCAHTISGVSRRVEAVRQGLEAA